MRRQDRAVTELSEIKNILDRCKTASVAMIDKDIPYVLPLSYGYELQDDGSLVLYFHGAKEGRKIDVLKQNNQVCFTIFSEGEPLHAEVPCDSGYYYASIIGNGVAEFIEDSAEKRFALAKMFERQTGRQVQFTEGQASSVCVFKIVSKDYTGKQKTRE